MNDLIGKLTVVGDEQRTAGVIIQPSDRKYPLLALHQVDHRLTASVIAGCTQRLLGLVHQIIHLVLPGDDLTVYLDDISLLHLCSQLGDDLAVDAHTSLCDILFRLAPGSDPAGGNYFLQSFHPRMPPAISAFLLYFTQKHFI